MSDPNPLQHLMHASASRLIQRWRSLTPARRAAWRIALLLLLVAAAIEPMVLYVHPTLAVEARYAYEDLVDPWGRPWVDDGEDGPWTTRQWSAGPNAVDEAGRGDDLLVYDFGPIYSSGEAVTRLLPAVAPAFAAPGLLVLAFLCTPWLRRTGMRQRTDVLRALATAVMPAVVCVATGYWATRPTRPWTSPSSGVCGGVLSFVEDLWFEEASDWLQGDLFALDAGGFEVALPAWVFLAGAAALACLALALWLRLGPAESHADDPQPRRIRAAVSIGAGGKLALVLAAHLCLIALYLSPLACRFDPRVAVDVSFRRGDERDPWGSWYQRKYTTWDSWVYYSIGPNGWKEDGQGDDLFPSQPHPDGRNTPGPLKDVCGQPLPNMDPGPWSIVVFYARPALLTLAAVFVWYVLVPGLLCARWPRQRFRGFVVTASAPSLVALCTTVWLVSRPWAHVVMPRGKLLVLPPQLALGGTLLALALTWTAGSWLGALPATPPPEDGDASHAGRR